MKNKIQEKLAVERSGMSDADIRSGIERELATSDEPIAQWWRTVAAAKEALARG